MPWQTREILSFMAFFPFARKHPQNNNSHISFYENFIFPANQSIIIFDLNISIFIPAFSPFYTFFFPLCPRRDFFIDEKRKPCYSILSDNNK